LYCEIDRELRRGPASGSAFPGRAWELERTVRIPELQLLHGYSVGPIAQYATIEIGDNGAGQ
jgi:hypothetical protein